MDRNSILAVLFLFLVVADVSNASLLSKIRKLAASNSPNNSTTNQGSPLPSTISNVAKPEPKQVDSDSADTTKSKDHKAPDNSSKVDPSDLDNGKGSNKTNLVNPPSSQNQTGDGKNQRTNQKSGDKVTEASSQSGMSNENCTGIANRCKDDLGTLVACIQSFENGSKESVLVQNDGEDTLKVNFTIPSSENHLQMLELPKHKTKKIDISQIVGKSSELIFRAGNGECVLHVKPHVSEGKLFLRLPTYAKLLTPINGAYFLILTVFIFGGTWACCKFGKKRQQGGVPYQELEMALPDSTSATNVETAEGWDQGWDDDWDEENAVKSPVARHVGSISANGLTSRSPNKDGWENSWDD